MRFLIHEFGGYSFPLQLSRALATRGHEVIHVYPTGLPGPKGRLDRSPIDPDTLLIVPVTLSGQFRKYSPVRRLLTQRIYAHQVKALIADFSPDVVMSADTPIDVQYELLSFCQSLQISFVHWVQDVYGPAIEFFLHKAFGPAAKWLSWPFKQLEKRVAANSDSLILISQEFADLHKQWGTSGDRMTVIENWAPLDEIPALHKDNDWSRQHGLDNKQVFLYSGTMGHKHRPDLVYQFAKCLPPDSVLVVISQGIGRNYLEQQPRLENLRLMDFQPYHRLPEVLASADVLIATLEAEAGDFAVPSKILSYLCAGRPIILAAPSNNLSTRVISRSGGGYVVNSEDLGQWEKVAKELANNSSLRATLGQRARAYAEATFSIINIAREFESVLTAAYRPNEVRERRLHPVASGQNQ